MVSMQPAYCAAVVCTALIVQVLAGLSTYGRASHHGSKTALRRRLAGPAPLDGIDPASPYRLVRVRMIYNTGIFHAYVLLVIYVDFSLIGWLELKRLALVARIWKRPCARPTCESHSLGVRFIFSGLLYFEDYGNFKKRTTAQQSSMRNIKLVYGFIRCWRSAAIILIIVYQWHLSRLEFWLGLYFMTSNFTWNVYGIQYQAVWRGISNRDALL
jgi:hypothetical protein